MKFQNECDFRVHKECDLFTKNATCSQNAFAFAAWKKKGQRLRKNQAMIQYLVFGGGGIRGQAYSGCLDEMKRELDFDFRTLRGAAGTSVGALYAAAIASGIPIDKIAAISDSTSLIDIVSPHLTTFVMNYGFDTGKSLEDWIDAHLGSKKETMDEMFSRTGIDLRVYVTNMTSCTSEILSHETAPNLPVARAVFMSMCLPPLFCPAKYKGCVYVDGGIYNNFPIRAFGDPEHTVGLKVCWNYVSNLGGSFETYMSRLTYCVLSSSEEEKWKYLDEAYKNNTVLIDCGDVSTLHWRVTPNMAKALDRAGRGAMRVFLRKNISPVAKTSSDVGVQTE